jgi:hypothetical protein
MVRQRECNSCWSTVNCFVGHQVGLVNKLCVDYVLEKDTFKEHCKYHYYYYYFYIFHSVHYNVVIITIITSSFFNIFSFFKASHPRYVLSASKRYIHYFKHNCFFAAQSSYMFRLWTMTITILTFRIGSCLRIIFSLP